MDSHHGDGDGDFSSSVAWDSPADPSSSSSHQPAAAGPSHSYSAYEHTATATVNPDRNASRFSAVHVLDGKTELEGTSDMFVSYLVTAETDLASFHSTKPSSRRRYQDFVFLRHALVKDFQACVVPPLPDKHRMEYVVGDRFSPDFIERRRIDLERFLQRVARHPKLSRTVLFQNFLESTEWNVYKHKHSAQASSAASSSSAAEESHGLLDNLSDTLLNAFSKLKKPDERFTAIRQYLDSFEEGLGSIERLGSRSRGRLNDLSQDYEDLAVSVQGLGYLESGITEPLMRFERSLVDMSTSLKLSSTSSSSDLVEHLHSLLAYSHAFKGVLKSRDQKQLDFEELSSYLSNVVTERDRIAGGYGYGLGLSSYFKDKLEGLKGGETDMSKAARLQRLDHKIKELQDAVLASQQTSTAFNDSVLEEHETFRTIKRHEMKQLLGDYAKGQIEFQKKVLQSWDKTIPFIQKIHVEA
ncbi:Snx4p [Sporobolomyces koalae]|uniref:Snx4p n=1 Tax=Sporobolomyces koalae TaxID=500713 RepID=UPI003177ACB3